MQLQTLGDLWERNARLYPEFEAIICGSVRRTYAHVLDRSARLASALHGLGAKKQDRVTLLARNRAEWFDYYAACERYGYIAATLNFRLAAEEFAYVLNDSSAAYLLFEDQYTGVIEQLRARLPHVREYICIGESPPWAHSYDSLLSGGSPDGPPFTAAPTDAVRLIYTSGTTGRPKGVIRGQIADLALARICSTTSEMPDGCRELIMMPMFHIGAQSMASGAHWSGGTVVLHREFSPHDILMDIEAERIQVMHVTPTIVQALLEQLSRGNYQLGSILSVVYAGAPMPVPLCKRGLERLGNVFINCYGSTEVGAAIILQKRFHKVEGSPEQLKLLSSLGQEHADCRVRIVDDKGTDCPAGSAGEIALRSDATMSGYWNNSGATIEALRGGWLRTGDIGVKDELGFVYLLDRKADMIISGGENIYAREVENALYLHAAVRDVAVIGVPDSYWGEAVKAIVVRKENSLVTADELIEHCRRHIARYKVPKHIEFASELPLLPSSKIDKVRLRRLYGK